MYQSLGEGELAGAAEVIFEEFILPGADKELNIKHSLRQDLDDAYARKNFTRALFEAAQNDIYQLMVTDPYPRFLKSGLYNPEAQEKRGTIRVCIESLSDANGGNSLIQKTLNTTTSETAQSIIQAVLSQFKLDDDSPFYTLSYLHKGKETPLKASEIPLVIKLKCQEEGEDVTFFARDARKDKHKPKEKESSVSVALSLSL